MIYITGDKHGDYNDVFNFCNKYKTTREDILIVLGDAGINYYLNDNDYILKNSLLQLPITLFSFMEIMKKDQKIFQVIKQKYLMKGLYILKKNILIYYLLKMEKFITLMVVKY